MGMTALDIVILLLGDSPQLLVAVLIDRRPQAANICICAWGTRPSFSLSLSTMRVPDHPSMSYFTRSLSLHEAPPHYVARGTPTESGTSESDALPEAPWVHVDDDDNDFLAAARRRFDLLSKTIQLDPKGSNCTIRVKGASRYELHVIECALLTAQQELACPCHTAAAAAIGTRGTRARGYQTKALYLALMIFFLGMLMTIWAIAMPQPLNAAPNGSHLAVAAARRDDGRLFADARLHFGDARGDDVDQASHCIGTTMMLRVGSESGTVEMKGSWPERTGFCTVNAARV